VHYACRAYASGVRLIPPVLVLSVSSCGSRVDLPIDLAGSDADVSSCSFVETGGVSIQLLETGVIATENRSFRGAILEASADTITIDRCHPAADCIRDVAQLRVSGTALSALPAGAFVSVDYENIPTPWIGFTQRVVVRSVTEWGGMSNPAKIGEAVLLAAADGVVEARADVPFTVKKESLACPPSDGACMYQKAYAFRFTAGANSVAVTMGSSAKLTLGTYSLFVRNHQAWDSKCTDDYWNWAWTAVWVP
jgi:hypothetical protein